jgi:hypothetical protein
MSQNKLKILGLWYSIECQSECSELLIEVNTGHIETLSKIIINNNNPQNYLRVHFNGTSQYSEYTHIESVTHSLEEMYGPTFYDNIVNIAIYRNIKDYYGVKRKMTTLDDNISTNKKMRHFY